ncbi:unnamed protein product [Euphydryas editha]|uniref:Uncharacterized protein n=1 Tax=Euphydryas editha TaxID=104508 RepID=A0AAU9UVL3_EUPED|nr:unnamed protein product [Euphydryas editha]
MSADDTRSLMAHSASSRPHSEGQGSPYSGLPHTIGDPADTKLNRTASIHWSNNDHLDMTPRPACPSGSRRGVGRAGRRRRSSAGSPCATRRRPPLGGSGRLWALRTRNKCGAPSGNLTAL